MKTRTKIIIALVAVFISLFEFNLIVSWGCFNDVLRAGKEAGYVAIAEFSPEHADAVVTASLKP